MSEQPKPTLAQFFAAVFGECVDHAHEKIGHCVYCVTCGRRLYQGEVMSADELAAVKEVIVMGASSGRAADTEGRQDGDH